MSEQNIAAVKQVFVAFNAGDAALAETVISSDYLNYEALDNEDERTDKRGLQEFAATLHWLHSAFSDLHFEIQEIIAAENKVVVRGVMTGKQTGNFMQFGPTGKAIASEQVHIFSLDQGKVLTHRARRDDLKMLLQMGVLQWSSSAA